MNFNETIRILNLIKENRIEDYRFQVSSDTRNLLCMLRRYGVFLRQPSGAMETSIRPNSGYYNISVRMSKYCDSSYVLRNLETIWKVGQI